MPEVDEGTLDQVARYSIGISGWAYKGWRGGGFYPKGLAQRAELAYASSRLTSIELNASFYALQKPTSYRNWYAQTPEDFVFAIKGGRYITHMRQLRGVESALANFLASGPLALGHKLGPFLWQLPPSLGYDPERLAEFFALLPRTTVEAALIAERHEERMKDRAWTAVDADRPLRHALEVRHASYEDPSFPELLRAHDIALVTADTAGKWPFFETQTSDFAYARLHGDIELYVSGYTAESLDGWAAKVRAWSEGDRDVHVYFDNDVKVRAPYDAMSLLERLRDPGPEGPGDRGSVTERRGV